MRPNFPFLPTTPLLLHNDTGDNPNIVCKDLISDYKAAEKLAKKYPMTFKWVPNCIC